MMGKLQEMKQKTDEVKMRLANIQVEGTAENGKVRVVSDGNRKIVEIRISDELLQAGDKEEIEELSLLAVNRALEKAEKVSESEMQDIAKGFLPGM